MEISEKTDTTLDTAPEVTDNVNSTAKPPKAFKHYTVNFDEVKTLEDVKTILEQMGLSFYVEDNKVSEMPPEIKRLFVEKTISEVKTEE